MTAKLPTYYFSQTNVAMNLAEILITLGVTNAAAEPEKAESGRLEIPYSAQWMTTVSLSPQAALQLYAALGETLGAYQNMFGDIPQPKAPAEMN